MLEKNAPGPTGHERRLYLAASTVVITCAAGYAGRRQLLAGAKRYLAWQAEAQAEAQAAKAAAKGK